MRSVGLGLLVGALGCAGGGSPPAAQASLDPSVAASGSGPPAGGPGAEHCTAEGQSFDGKTVGARCCEDLSRLDAVLLRETPPGCDYDHAPGPGVFYCTRCGDGACRDPENRCNCPGDCAQ